MAGQVSVEPGRKKVPKPRGRRAKGEPVLLGPEPEKRPRAPVPEPPEDEDDLDDDGLDNDDELDPPSARQVYGVAPPTRWEELDGQILTRIDPTVLRQTPLPGTVAEVSLHDRGQLEEARERDQESDVELPEPPASRKPRSLDDLMGSFPIGDGQHTIKVVRNKPIAVDGIAFSGEQVPIRKVMDIAEFTRAYGGGDYTLTVYGPPRRGGIIDPGTGLPRPKALSADVKVGIPWTGALGRDPIPRYPDDEEFADEEDNNDMTTADMRPNALRRPASPADAKIHSDNLGFQERKELREREEQRSVEDRTVKASTDVLRLTTEAQDKSTERVIEQTERMLSVTREERIRAEERAERADEERRRLEQQLREAEIERIRHEQAKPTPVAEMAQSMAALMAAMRPDSSGPNHQLEALRGEFERYKESFQRETSLLRDAHSRELTQMREATASELRREKEATERALDTKEKIHEALLKSERERLKITEERAERIAREAQESADRRVREAEDRAERRVREQREDYERRLADLARSHESMLNTEHRSAEREMRALKESLEARVEMERAMAQNQTVTLQSELQRREAEIGRVREEALSKGDFLSEFERLKGVAGALGWNAEAGGAAPAAEQPLDWKTAAFSMGQTLVQNLPAILDNAANAVAASRGQAPVPAMPMLMPQQSMQQLPPAPRPRALPPPPPGMYMPPAVIAPAGAHQAVPASQQQYTEQSMVVPTSYTPQQQPFQPQPPMQPSPQEMGQPYQAPPPLVQPAPAQAPASAPQAAAPSPAPELPPAPAAPPAPRIDIPDSTILEMRVMFEDGYKLHPDDPAAFRATLQEQAGPDTVRMIAHSLDLSRMAELLLNNAESADSPLLRQQGQQWLSQLLEICKQ